MLFANQAGDVSWAYLNDGGRFSADRRIEFETHTAKDIVVRDFNRDGYNDVFFTNHQYSLTGDPKLDGTYHLTTGSAAVDVAVATDVSVDIDGDSRPLGGGPDIGADELVPAPPGAFGKVCRSNGASCQPTGPT